MRRRRLWLSAVCFILFLNFCSIESMFIRHFYKFSNLLLLLVVKPPIIGFSHPLRIPSRLGKAFYAKVVTKVTEVKDVFYVKKVNRFSINFISSLGVKVIASKTLVRTIIL
uniref:Putative secreted protein n=1 Tax=Panstrongylus lignarius TaxID=156445 RepID=A0A224Y2A9_9HEMI